MLLNEPEYLLMADKLFNLYLHRLQLMMKIPAKSMMGVIIKN
jgi:hypothetical protein